MDEPNKEPTKSLHNDISNNQENIFLARSTSIFFSPPRYHPDTHPLGTC